MTVFWLVAVCLTFAALLFVLPPLLRREPDAEDLDHDRLNVGVYQNQLTELEQDLARGVISKEHYDRTRTEIERRLLEDVPNAAATSARAPSVPHGGRVAAGILAIGLPVAALLIYSLLGRPDAIEGRVPVADAGSAAVESAEHPDSGQQIEAMIEQLMVRLEAEPENLEGWLMLARSLRFVRRHNEAADAFERAMPIMANNAELLADYADTLAIANNSILEGKPIQIVERALSIDPRNVQALWLKGTYDFEKSDYVKALTSWRQIQQLVPPGSEDAQSMARNIAEVEARIRAAGQEVPAAQPLPATAVAAGPATVTGRVQLDPNLASQASGNDTVFIFARAAQGPKMPLAILRKQVSELPVEFQLDETMAMMPAMSLANYREVVVGARISKTGNATPQSGDLQGQSEIIQVGAKDVSITINSVVP